MDNVIDWNKELPGCEVRRDVPMGKMTTMKVGGPADWVLFTKDAREIAKALVLAAQRGVTVTVMGNGSNLIVRDGGIRGLVVVVDAGMADVRIDGTCLHAQAGAPLKRVALAALEAGLAGLEFAAGIPGNVGGALFMNAGAYGGEMAHVVREAIAVMPDGSLQAFDVDEMEMGYRHSVFEHNGAVITDVKFDLAHGDARQIRERMRDLNARRQEKQPLSLPSAGSVFRRPPGRYAGQLIEEAGMKGARVGGAQVSEKHAGFIVNTGGATALDVLGLIAMVQDRVLAASGILLETEVRVLGEDEHA
jgi:UDP-N-acetylmuramate dehydrogenase